MHIFLAFQDDFTLEYENNDKNYDYLIKFIKNYIADNNLIETNKGNIIINLFIDNKEITAINFDDIEESSTLILKYETEVDYLKRNLNNCQNNLIDCKKDIDYEKRKNKIFLKLLKIENFCGIVNENDIISKSKPKSFYSINTSSFKCSFCEKQFKIYKNEEEVTYKKNVLKENEYVLKENEYTFDIFAITHDGRWGDINNICKICFDKKMKN